MVAGAGRPAMDTSSVAHISVLSRVVETLRFTVGPSLLTTTVTLENLTAAFRAHAELRCQQTHCHGDTATSNENEDNDDNDDDVLRRERAAEMVQVSDTSCRHVAIDSIEAGERESGSTPSDVSATEDSRVSFDEISEKLRRVWAMVEAAHDSPVNVTYGDLFDFEFPHFPETTAEQRTALAELSTSHEIITKAMATDALASLDRSGPTPRRTTPKHAEGHSNICSHNPQEEDSQAIDFLFASGADAMPSLVFADVVDSLGRHPQALSFAPHFVDQRCTIGRRMLLMIPQLIALIVTVAIAPSVVNVEQRVIHENMMHWINNDWTTGCGGPDGAAAHVAGNTTGCDFLGMSVLNVNRPSQDVLRFLRSQLPLLLWRNASASATAADAPFGGVFPVGVLTIRHVTEDTNDDGCDRIGIETYAAHEELPAFFGCGNEWVLQIPFSATRAEALEKTAGVQLPAAGRTHGAVIVEFAGYSPTVRMTVFNRILLTLPRGGGVWPKVVISPIEHDMHKRILPVFLVKLFGAAWALTVTVNYARTTRSLFSTIDVDIALDLTMTVIITISYALFLAVKTVPEGLLDVTQPFEGIDGSAVLFSAAMSLFAVYSCLVIGTFVRFARDIAGLQVLLDIMRSAALEICGLGVLFAAWTAGFVCAAMMLFGYTTPEYSSFGPAARSLFLYYVGSNDLARLAKNHPRVGPAFFVVFQIFVVFFALNLLIAVLTAPVPRIKERIALIKDTVASVRDSVRDQKGLIAKVWLEVEYYIVWPVMNTLLDAVPGPAHYRYLQCFSVLDALYQSVPNSKTPMTDAMATIDNALVLLELIAPDSANLPGQINVSHSQDDHDDGATLDAIPRRGVSGQRGFSWNSPLLETVLEKAVIGNKVAFAIVLVIISKESRWGAVRDARLLRMLSFYERFSSKMQRVLDLQEQFRPTAAAMTTSIAATVDRRTIPTAGSQRPQQTSLMPADAASVRDLHTGRCDGEGQTPVLSEGAMVANVQGESLTNRVFEKLENSPTKSPPTLNSNQESGESEAWTVEVGVSITFAFTQELRGRLLQAPTFLFIALLSLSCGMAFFAPFFTRVEYTAFLSDALDAGILHMPWRTRCLDAECKAAMSYNKTLRDVGDVSEYNQWLSEVLQLQLYPPADTSTGNTNTSEARSTLVKDKTLFDPRIRLDGPFTIRQIRGRRTECGSFNGAPASTGNTSFYAQRAKNVDEFECVLGAASGFTTVDKPAPPGGYPSLIGQSAYIERDMCTEVEPRVFSGRFALSYHCRGYSATITSRAALQEVIDSNWVDGETRLVAVTAVFSFGDDAVEYTTLTELGENGGGAVSEGFAFPTKTDLQGTGVTAQQATFYVVIIAQLLVHTATFTLYAIRRFRSPASEDATPGFPIVAAAVAVLVFGVFRIAFPPSSQPLRYNIAVGLCAIVYFGYLLTVHVMFPLAILSSRKMVVLIATLKNTVGQLLYVVPYFIMAFIALTMLAYITWGRYLHSYSRLPWAAQEVIVLAFGGSFDIEPLQAQRFTEAQLFAVIVFMVMIVILGNLFLAMVTSASGDAQEQPLATELCESILRTNGATCLHGPFYNCALAGIVFALRSASTSQRIREYLPTSWMQERPRSPSVCTYRGRLLLPTETLLACFPPLRCNATLRLLCHGALPAAVHANIAPYLLELRHQLETRRRRNFTQDRRKEQVELSRYVLCEPPPMSPTSCPPELAPETTVATPPPAAENPPASDHSTSLEETSLSLPLAPNSHVSLKTDDNGMESKPPQVLGDAPTTTLMAKDKIGKVDIGDEASSEAASSPTSPEEPGSCKERGRPPPIRLPGPDDSDL